MLLAVSQAVLHSLALRPWLFPWLYCIPRPLSLVPSPSSLAAYFAPGCFVFPRPLSLVPRPWLFLKIIHHPQHHISLNRIINIFRNKIASNISLNIIVTVKQIKHCYFNF